MTKKIMTMLIAVAMLTPAMTSLAAETTEVMPISAEVAPISAETAENETLTIESATAADIEKYVNDETVILDKDGKAVDKVNAGDKIYVDTYRNVVVILDDEYEGSIAIDVFNPNGGDETGTSYINELPTLVLNIGDDTVIVDKDGNELDKTEIAGKLAVVYYTVTTRSLPPQTTPEKVVVLGEAAPEEAESPVFKGEVTSVDGNVIKTADNSITVEDYTTIIGLDGKAADSVKVGDTIIADKENAVIAIVESDYAGTINVGVFTASTEDEFGDYMSVDKDLALIIGDDTIIADINGNPVAKDQLASKKLVVYSTIMTMSIPAQTPVERIVVLNAPAARDGETTEESNEFYGVVTSYENGVIETENGSFATGMDTAILSEDGTVKVGDKVFVNREKNIVAVTNADYEGAVKIDTFRTSTEDEFGEFMSGDGSLAISVSDTTELVDREGNKLSKDDINGSVAAVYYTVTAMSYPGQTVPEKIVIVSRPAAALMDYTFTYGDKSYTVTATDVDGSNYIPVRAVAEALGFVVGWDGENVTVSVSDDNNSTAFKVNETELNDKGDKAYISDEDLTYVPVEFFTNKIPAEFSISIEVSQN